MTIQDAEQQRAAPYATGGGGTVLEHRYGAVLLCSLLTGDPISELGDDTVPISVRFQANAFSPVDDLVIVGRTPDDEERRVSIGVRRSPALVASEDASAHLLSSYLQVVTEHWDEVQKGRWRLALAVVSPNPAVQQVRELAEIARGTTDEMMFHAEVHRPRRTNSGVRGRLPNLIGLVAAAATGSGMDLDDDGVREVTWRLLYSLRVRELRLEGDETDRTFAVTRLRTVVPDESVVAADNLFSRLAELANSYAPAGAVVTDSLLRQHLSGISLDRSPSYIKAWRILDGLSERLRDRTGFRLTDHHANLELARADARKSLAAAIEAAANDSRALVVHGEPDIGKSALTLRTTEELGTAGAAAMTLSLRDLPETGLELEALLGGRLKDVLGGMAVGRFRLLVVDGTESVLEGRSPLLTDVATAALRAGLCLVAVTRSDGMRAVVQTVSGAMASAGITSKVEEYEVQRLTSSETSQLTTTFDTLARLQEEPRAAWLLGRPGIVDLLLRAGAAAELPGGPLSEADVFAVIWHHLVRKGEVTHRGGPSPDARDRALVSIARRLLLPDNPGERPDTAALPSLRSDGLLLAPGPTSAWNPADQFASDLVRDLSVARLLITEGFDAIGTAGAPRWALRAVRLAFQATLAASHNTEEVWERLQSTFAALAARHGQRWAEVPLEAMLTLGSSEKTLARVWPRLLTEKAAGLRTMLRLALQRYVEHGIGDPTVLGPVVALTFCSDGDLGEDDRYDRRSTGEQVSELMLAWLRGLVMTHAGPHALRQQVRDRLLAGDLVPYDEFAVEALAMLGPDLDEPAETFLKRLAEAGGGRLAPAVESLGPVLAMSEYQPQLLITLTEAFYIERYDDEFGWSHGGLNDGIRHHQKMGGINTPMAAWYYGPFFRLLNTRPVEALSFINRMLDHAASVRVGKRQPWETGPQSDELPPGLDLDLPGVGVRRCIGDSHVWSWYRGSSVGPYPCMSTLLAVERFADALVDTLQWPLASVSQLLLLDCNNLAMPGLVVGLLVRHLDQVGDLLDQWLARPELWNLEFSRALGEGQLHVQGADPPELVGRDRRRYNFRDVGAKMTLRAMLAGDQHRLDALAAVADELVQRARALVADSNENDDMVTVEGWASGLRPENYRVHQADDGSLIIQHEPPVGIASGLAPSLASLARGNEAMRLQMTYGRSEDRVVPVDTLIEDLALGRELADDPPVSGVLHPEDPIAAVAAAAIVAHAHGRIRVPDEDLHWAAEVLIEAATHPRIDELSSELTMYRWAADRSAAAGLPTLLLPPFDHLDLDRLRIAEALRSCSTSIFDEVRLAFAHGVIPIWETPCETRTDAGSCRHKTAWTAVEEGLRDCRLGDWDGTSQRRLPDHLKGPYEETLPTVETERLLVNRLTAPLIATVPVARGECCVTDAARRLLPALFDAHRRGLDHWASKGYDRHNRHRTFVAELLIRLAVADDDEQLTEYVRVFSSNASALDEFLRDLALRFTYDDDLRPALQDVWRLVMTTALDALEAGADLRGADHFRSGTALAGLLPTPQLNTGDTDPDATLERARQSWITPDAITDLITRWLPFAHRESHAVDAVVHLALCASPLWQATTGLVWVEDVIDRDYSAVARKCWSLTTWLQAVRASGLLDADSTARWRRIMDGLAAEGDSRAVPLQQAEE